MLHDEREGETPTDRNRNPSALEQQESVHSRRPDRKPTGVVARLNVRWPVFNCEHLHQQAGCMVVVSVFAEAAIRRAGPAVARQ
jgi:hypothetical protein